MPFSRRELLAACSSAPLLAALLPRHAFAQAATPPRRIVFWFQPGGVAHEAYWVRPGSTETNWGYDTTGDRHELLPLAPFHDITLHFDALERVQSLQLPANDSRRWEESTKLPMGLTDLAGCVGPHPLKPLENGNPTRELTIGHDSAVSLLTGRFPHGRVYTAGSGTFVEWLSVGESFDVAIARELGVGARISSVQLGAMSGPSFSLSTQGMGRRLPVQQDPRQSFQSLFAGIPQTPGVDPQAEALRRKAARRKSALDVAFARFRELEGGLTSVDRTRARQHFEAYRDVEARLTTPPMVTSPACRAPMTPPAQLNLDDPLRLPDFVSMMVDQTVLALACDVTRVATLSWTFAASNQVYSFLPGFTAPIGPNGEPSADGHHPLTHDAYDGSFKVSSPANQAAFDKLRRIGRWYAEQLASFLSRLQAIREPDGSTLLDNTLVVVLNELNHGGAHNNGNLPVRVYGGLRGRLRTGRYLPLPATPINDLYVSLANALGVPWTTFGEPRFDYRMSGGPTNWQWVSKSHVVGPIPGLVT
jgi:hypothetical protein